MSHVYGDLSISAKGTREQFQKAEKYLREQYANEGGDSCLKVLCSNFQDCIERAESDGSGVCAFEVNDFYDIISMPINALYYLAEEVPGLYLKLSGSLADSITDDDEEFEVVSESGSDSWDGDDAEWLFDMCSSY